jgi:hypothetical protein
MLTMQQPIHVNDECRNFNSAMYNLIPGITLYRQLKFKLHNIELVCGLQGTQRDISFQKMVQKQ